MSAAAAADFVIASVQPALPPSSLAAAAGPRAHRPPSFGRDPGRRSAQCGPPRGVESTTLTLGEVSPATVDMRTTADRGLPRRRQFTDGAGDRGSTPRVTIPSSPATRRVDADERGRVYAAGVLGSSSVVAFIPVTDIAMARSFYESTLGLPVVDDSPFALVVDANGTNVRITPVPDLRPQPFTILGWEVADIEAAVEGLVARGVGLHPLRRHGPEGQRCLGVAQRRPGRVVRGSRRQHPVTDPVPAPVAERGVGGGEQSQGRGPGSVRHRSNPPSPGTTRSPPPSWRPTDRRRAVTAIITTSIPSVRAAASLAAAASPPLFFVTSLSIRWVLMISTSASRLKGPRLRTTCARGSGMGSGSSIARTRNQVAGSPSANGANSCRPVVKK